MRIEFLVNGEPRVLDAPPLRRLLDLLREDLRLTGTKEGCGEGECGSCAVLLDGELVNACLVPAAQLTGRSVLTIEGLGSEERPDPVQGAFLKEGAVQCGFCIPGMVMASHALLRKNPRPRREEIRAALAGNLCRCTGYERILRAVERAAEETAALAAPSPGPVLAGGPQLMEPSGSLDPRRATTLPEALRRIADPGAAALPAAGCTDLLSGLHLGLEAAREIVDLSGVAELRAIEEEGGFLCIGAGVVVSRLLEDPLVARHAPALREAASLFGAPAIRNRATVGGNLMSASPAADLPPVLLALEAVAVLVDARRRREVPLADFFPAYRRTARQPGEILHSVRIPIPRPASRQGFFKVGTRRAQAIAKVSLAASLELEGRGVIRRPRLAAGSVAPVPLLLGETSRWLEGRPLSRETAAEAESRAASEVRPIDDVRSNAAYRRAVTGRLVRRFLEDQLSST